jgi:hypothetical protein
MLSLTMVIWIVLHLGQALYFRLWWLIPSAVFSGILEVVGWGGRVWESKNPFSEKPFLLQ